MQNKKLVDILREEDTRAEIETVQDKLTERIEQIPLLKAQEESNYLEIEGTDNFYKTALDAYLNDYDSFVEEFTLNPEKTYKEIVPIVNKITDMQDKGPELIIGLEQTPEYKKINGDLNVGRAAIAGQTIIGSAALTWLVQSPTSAMLWAGANAVAYGVSEYLSYRHKNKEKKRIYGKSVTPLKEGDEGYIYLADDVPHYKIPGVLGHEYAHHLTQTNLTLEGDTDIFSEGYSTGIERLSSLRYGLQHDIYHFEFQTLLEEKTAIDFAQKLLDSGVLNPGSTGLEDTIKENKYVIGEALFKAYEHKYGPEIYSDLLKGKNIFS